MERRQFLKATAGFAVIGLAIPAADARKLSGLSQSAIRGSINATDLGAQPSGSGDQSAVFGRMLAEASRQDTPLFLPPGRYVVSDIALPPRTRIIGISEATHIALGGGGLFSAQRAEVVELSSLVLDGAGRPLDGNVDGLLDVRQVARLVLDNCSVIASTKHGIALQGAKGRITHCSVANAAHAGIRSLDASGLEISNNHVSDCGNGGILVWRSRQGDDGTTVTGNRIERVRADDGGTGQNGNGINAFRADTVGISGNIVSDCAFSAIRANGSSDSRISGNTCLRSGETAIYAEFSFEGAAVNANIVDGAANGISIVNFDKGGRLATCTGNIVRNLTATGPYPAQGAGFGTGISVEADSTVSGNVIEGAPLFGIGIGWGPFMRDVVATGNLIRTAGVGIAVSVVEGTGLAVISDNIIDGARNGAIVGYRWADPATGDLARGAANPFPAIQIGANKAG